jgi:predicted aspartyl protease
MRLLLMMGVAFFFLLAQPSVSPCGPHGETSDRITAPRSEAKDITLEGYMGVLQTVQIEIGSETLPFIFDTGGGLTLLTPQVAERFGCRPYGRVTGFRMSGERLDLERCGETELKVGGMSPRVELTVFDLMSLLPEGWPELGGLVSLQTFRNEILTLDLAENLLSIESEGSFLKRTAGMKPMSARLDNQCGGACLDIFVEVKARTGSIWLEFDTGNSGPLLLAPHALRQLGLSSEADKEESSVSAENESSEAATFETTLDFVGLGPITVTARQQEMIYDGVINADTIRKLLVTMNLETGEMWGTVKER